MAGFGAEKSGAVLRSFTRSNGVRYFSHSDELRQITLVEATLERCRAAFADTKHLRKGTKPAATRTEAYALAYALRDMGESHLGAAALICFEWHQRPEHVLRGDITWADYRPSQRPDAALVRHPKTGEKGWWPLDDKDGPLFPEIEAYLSGLKCLGLPIVLTSGKRGPARPYSNEFAERRVRTAERRCSSQPRHARRLPAWRDD